MRVDKNKPTGSSSSSNPKCSKSLIALKNRVDGISCNISANSSSRSLISRRLSQITGDDDLSSLFTK